MSSHVPGNALAGGSPAGKDDDDIIANVLGQMDIDPPKPAEPDVSNIFSDPQEPLKPMTRPVPVDATAWAGFGDDGTDTTLDLGLWKADPMRKPRVIRGFDTTKDRVLVLKDDTEDDPEFEVKKTKDGVPVLCLGTARLLALPGLKGDAPINALLLDVA